jgi:N-acetylglutamate synthase-like GNAT family acetyltransferase
LLEYKHRICCISDNIKRLGAEALMLNLTHRKATLNDLNLIVELLLDDEFGAKRESSTEMEHYIGAFNEIDRDPNHFLMVVESSGEIVATCHLTFLPSLTYKGSKRMQIEAVRTKAALRGHSIGKWMINQAISYAKQNSVSIVQLTTNKKRQRAEHFYEKLGFESSHEGMKLFLP